MHILINFSVRVGKVVLIRDNMKDLHCKQDQLSSLDIGLAV
jgi:hypothetical protein